MRYRHSPTLLERAMTDLAFISVMLGALLCFALGLATINAYDGEQWAIELVHDPLYLLVMLGSMFACLIAFIAAIAYRLALDRR